MFFTYLRRELVIRRKQTAVVVIGLALAVALVVVVNALAAGVQAAQNQALDSVYGVGTDITVSQTEQPGEGGPRRFAFGAQDGTASNSGQAVSSSQLTTEPGKATFSSDELATAQGTEHVAAAAAVLALENITFNGELPDFSAGPPQPGQAGSGGADGAGGSAFDIDRFSVLGVDPAGDAVGPLTTLSVSSGRAFTADDATANVAMVDTTYATSNTVAVGDTLAVGGTDMQVVGIVESATGAGVTTGTDVYLPLATAANLAGLTDQVSDIYVQADSSQNIAAVDEALTTALPDATVSTQADLASSVSGSLATASNLLNQAGKWASIGALVAAFLLAILFTMSGVGRRTRELGTLKAIGWTNRRVVGQVGGEAMTTGLLGGVVGAVLGLIGVVVVNAVGITLTGSAATSAMPSPPPGMPAMSGPAGQLAQAASEAVDVVVQATLSPAVIAAAVGLALLGGLLAGIFGGGRAARLSPAEALRTVA